jgi:hypothetical protein
MHLALQAARRLELEVSRSALDRDVSGGASFTVTRSSIPQCLLVPAKDNGGGAGGCPSDGSASL